MLGDGDGDGGGGGAEARPPWKRAVAGLALVAAALAAASVWSPPGSSSVSEAVAVAAPPVPSADGDGEAAAPGPWEGAGEEGAGDAGEAEWPELFPNAVLFEPEGDLRTGQHCRAPQHDKVHRERPSPPCPPPPQGVRYANGTFEIPAGTASARLHKSGTVGVRVMDGYQFHPTRRDDAYNRGLAKLGVARPLVKDLPPVRALRAERAPGGGYRVDVGSRAEGVELYLDDGEAKYETYVDLHPVPEAVRRVSAPAVAAAAPPSIALLVWDATSRGSFLANCPRTVAWLRARAPGAVQAPDAPYVSYNFAGFHTVHEKSTAANMTPFFSAVQWNEAKRSPMRSERMENPDVPHDRLLWKHLRDRHGYVTQYGNDGCNHLFGAKASSWLSYFDHIVPMVTSGRDCPASVHGTCLGSRRGYDVLMDLMARFFTGASRGGPYPDGAPRFSYMHLVRAHDRVGEIAAVDGELVAFLERFEREAVLSNTLLVVASDHGFAHRGPGNEDARDQKSPSMHWMVPQRWLRATPGLHETLSANQGVLLSHYDMYVSLRHLVDERPGAPENEGRPVGAPDVARYLAGDAPIPAGGAPTTPGYAPLSVLHTRAPKNRTCGQAGIPAYHCDCFEPNHPPLPPQAEVAGSAEAVSVTAAGLRYLNARNEAHREACGLPFVLDEVLGATVSSTGRQEVRVRTQPGSLEWVFQADADTAGHFDGVTVAQTTRYAKYEPCTPEGAQAAYCVCGA